METRPPTLGGLAAVVGFALSCFALLIYLWATFGGPTPLAPKSYRFTALYDDASQLIAQTDVRISGVDVGRVTEVTQEGQLARAEIEVDADYAPLPADTRTILRRKTLLGEPFIELIPGTPEDEGGETLAEDGQLPLGQTEEAVDLDEVLRALNEETRRDIKLVLGELAVGVGDQGSNLNSALANLRPATESGADIFEVLASQRRAVRTLVHDSGEVLGALSERQGALSGLVSSGARVLETTAARDRELTEAVRLLPPFLSELRPTLELARDVGVKADPLLDELGPASKQIYPTVFELRLLAPDLTRLFRDLRPLLDRVPAGVPAFTATIAAARPLVRELRPALQDLVPAVEWLIPYDRELSAWLTKLALATQSSAGPEGRHILRTMIPYTQEGLAIYANDPLPFNRHNPYAKPDYLDQLGSPALRTFDCRNSNPVFDAIAPPCIEQGPFQMPDGFSGTYPHVNKAP
jgi:phospholipid/cholesterol/gamma-HCH transport system substrate-binding protein